MLVREESLGGVMAEVYGRLKRKPGVLIGQGPWVLGNGLLGTLEAHLSSSPMLLLTDFSDPANLALHGPYQSGTGDYGAWDARTAFRGVTKQVFQALEPASAVQATQLAIKHALAGQPGPVAVLYSLASLSGNVDAESEPRLYATSLYLPPAPQAADASLVAAAARALAAAKNPVIIAGNGVRIAQAYEPLEQLGGNARHPGRHHRRRARACSPKPTRWRSACSARSASPRPTRRWQKPISCWSSAPSSARPTRRARTPSCSTRRGRPSSRSRSSRATPPGRSPPSTC